MMNFGHLVYMQKDWQDIVVIDRTIEREGKKYYILGMTQGETVKLYILEPYMEAERVKLSKRKQSYRSLLKLPKGTMCHFWDCHEVCFGEQCFMVQQKQTNYLADNARSCDVQLFLAMLNAGWVVPKWLQYEDWDNLLMVTMELAGERALPKYTPDMPIVFKHSPNPMEHFVEKTVTLTVGKGRTLSFIDHSGDEVWCYINNVILMDMWQDIEKQFSDPRYAERFSPEQIEEMKAQSQQALAYNCPKGMYYVGIEYECSKDISLDFYTKDHLRFGPQSHSSNGTSYFFFVSCKPDKATGTHNLPLKGAAISTPVAADTVKIPAELFSYTEMMPAWEETV